MKTKTVKNVRKKAMLILLVLAVVFCAIGCVMQQFNAKFQKNATLVKGTVLRFNDDDDTLVGYVVEGHYYENWLHAYSSSWSKNDKIKLYVSDSDPNRVRSATLMNGFCYVMWGIAGAFVLAVLIMLLFGRKNGRRAEDFRLNGSLRHCKILSVQYNYNISVNNMHPVIVTAVYDDMITSTTYRSKHVYADAAQFVIGDNIDVYVKDGKHFVDCAAYLERKSTF